MGELDPSRKDKSLLYGQGFHHFQSDKPQYASVDASKFLSILGYGVPNDGASSNNNPQKSNAALLDSANQHKILVFPSSTYKTEDTIFIPPGASLVGALWSQIMASGPTFSDVSKPKVLARKVDLAFHIVVRLILHRVGNAGDQGVVKISNLTFTNDGATAETIFMEWNIHGQQQGSAAMWNTFFRIGGAAGTGWTESTCHHKSKHELKKFVYRRPRWSVLTRVRCMAAAMMLHVTSRASIYMENMWSWVAGQLNFFHQMIVTNLLLDHDTDSHEQTRIDMYGAHGVLIEPQGPSWVHSVSNEHCTLYNWQLSNARNAYLGHIQSETPCFQAGQSVSTIPCTQGLQTFQHDLKFPDCDQITTAFDTCLGAAYLGQS